MGQRYYIEGGTNHVVAVAMATHKLNTTCKHAKKVPVTLRSNSRKLPIIQSYPAPESEMNLQGGLWAFKGVQKYMMVVGTACVKFGNRKGALSPFQGAQHHLASP